MIKPTNLGDLYIAERICIKSEKGTFIGHYTDLKRKYNLNDQRLYTTLKDQFDKGNVEVSFKSELKK